MYPLRQGKGTIGSRDTSPRYDNMNGDCSKTWLKELEERKKERKRDNYSRLRDGSVSAYNGINNNDTTMNGYSNDGQPNSITLNKANNSLWNRRRTNSTNSIMTLGTDGNASENKNTSNMQSPSSQTYKSESPSTALPVLQQRGSSASPRIANKSGFWVQDPDDIHQVWVGADNRDGEAMSATTCPTPVTWSGMTNGSRFPLVTSPQKLQYHKMSGGQGETEGSGDIMDFQNRVKRFQQPEQQISQQGGTGAMVTRSSGSSTSASSQLMRSQQQQQKQHSSSSHSLTSSNVSELKSSATKSSSNLSELKSSISEVKSNISEMTAQSNSFSRSMSKTSSALQQQSASAGSFGKLSSQGFKSMGSLEALTMGSTEDLCIPDVTDDLKNLAVVSSDGAIVSPLTSGSSSPHSSQKEMQFEEKKVTSSSKTKVVNNNNSFESASGHVAESRKMKAGDVSYEESSLAAASKSKLEKDGLKAEKAAAHQEEARQLRAGDMTLREGAQKTGAAMKISGEGFSAHKSAISENQQRQMVTQDCNISQESSRKASKSGLTITAKGVCTKQSSESGFAEDNIKMSGFDNVDLNNRIMEFSSSLSNMVDQLKVSKDEDNEKSPVVLENINSMIKNAWNYPEYGHELGSSLCNVLRHNGGLDMVLESCKSVDQNLKFSSAKVIEQCLTTENRNYVVEKDLQTVVEVACDCAEDTENDHSRVGTGILEHLFKHNEGTCTNILKMGGLEAVLNKCKKSDKETLQHCAGALANLSLYGGEENQRLMMKQKAHLWLFPLAFHADVNIKYYACLAIAALVANKEIESSVIESGTLSLLEPFVNSHVPEEFANSNDAHRHGQSKSWLKRLVHVLTSKREEAKSLAAFHFCMEAGIKNKQRNVRIFREIGAVEPLKEVASSPNAIASCYAIQALKLMGEEVPHKLSQQVPLWSVEDTKEWVKQIGFEIYSEAFANSKVDGDLLLRITDINLCEDIGLSNGIMRQRFMRELHKLQQMADYSCCDGTKVFEFLLQLGPEFTQYTYSLIHAGVTRDYLRYLKEEQLIDECRIYNSIHRQKICNAIMTEEQNNLTKDLDIFISYRRSNGSQLASLLKVHMTLRGFSVFIDVERLEAGKFDNNLLNSIQQAKTFLLVLTQNALDRCIGDHDCKDWVHREIVAALRSDCTIIPIIDNFQWPDPELLPEDMRPICKFNGIRWIHDYQEACVDKLERFMRGEGQIRDALGRYPFGSTTFLGGLATPGTPSTLPRAPPIYQRTASIESGKGSSCSDKDLSKD